MPGSKELVKEIKCSVDRFSVPACYKYTPKMFAFRLKFHLLNELLFQHSQAVRLDSCFCIFMIKDNLTS